MLKKQDSTRKKRTRTKCITLSKLYTNTVADYRANRPLQRIFLKTRLRYTAAVDVHPAMDFNSKSIWSLCSIDNVTANQLRDKKPCHYSSKHKHKALPIVDTAQAAECKKWWTIWTIGTCINNAQRYWTWMQNVCSLSEYFLKEIHVKLNNMKHVNHIFNIRSTKKWKTAL